MKLSSLALLLLCVPASADVVIVNQFGLNFSPNNVTVNEGDTVRWVWHDGNHTVTEGIDHVVNGNEAFHNVLRSDVTIFEVVFDAPFLAANPRPNDKYDYFCEPHVAFSMFGVVNVIPNSAPGTPYCAGDGSGATCPCSNPGAADAGCANGTGSGAKLDSSGSASVSAGDLVLSGSQLVPNQPGLYFQGENAVSGGAGLAFGDGLRCAGGNVRRLQVRFASAAGTSATTINIAAAGSVAAGQTKRYQLWYRDPSTSPCGTGFNLSQGLEVVFTP